MVIRADVLYQGLALVPHPTFKDHNVSRDVMLVHHVDDVRTNSNKQGRTHHLARNIIETNRAGLLIGLFRMGVQKTNLNNTARADLKRINLTRQGLCEGVRNPSMGQTSRES